MKPARDLTTLAMYSFIVDELRQMTEALPRMTDNLTKGLKQIDKLRTEVKAVNFYVEHINEAMAVIESIAKLRESAREETQDAN